MNKGCVLLFLFFLHGCKDAGNEITSDTVESTLHARFTLIQPDSSGVQFSNLSGDFTEDYDYNIFKYEYLYNGGGVAAGDVNGDSLPDLYFTSTFSSNKLYLNLGGFRFLDVTDISGVAAVAGFKTGTSMTDIDGDGRLDIYVCRTGKAGDGNKSDLVFINTGNRSENGVSIPIFEEQSKKLGLDAPANTNHVCFFDFDRDGDLDLFQLNHRVDFEESTNFRIQQNPDGSIARITTPKTPLESNRLYRNDQGHFTDVTQQAGVGSSAYSLSVTPCDLNRDGWIDLYVAMDYIEPDMVLINNRNGTFTDQYSGYLKHSSLNSMGSDVADINNDGLEDIMVLDMKANDPVRYKSLIHGMQYDRYNLLVEYGYGRQVGRNVLQLNNGNNTFSDIGQYAGIAATDWSWGALVADLDNDGWKDAFIANGYRRDVANLDYLNYTRDSLHRSGGLTRERFPDINDILRYVPEQKLSNFLYINNTQLGFKDASAHAGMDQLSFSNGAAYADLDRDGDLDIIVNNVADPAFIYRNDVTGHHWLQIEIHEQKGNTRGIGASALVYSGKLIQHQMLMTNKGFFSSSEPILHFGLGKSTAIDSVIIQWPDGAKEIMRHVPINQRIHWRRGTGTPYYQQVVSDHTPLFRDTGVLSGWIHQEDDFVDFKRERLLPYMLSVEGPCMAIGDVNGDQLQDVYVGNGSGFSSALFLQNVDNTFTRSRIPAFEQDARYEDCGVVMEDMDGDGDRDMVVISGGNAFHTNHDNYMSRYYLNDGKGNFSRSPHFPIVRTNAGAVLAVDYDQDGDLDIIIGGRSTPGSYPLAPKSYLLQNNNGRFSDVTRDVFPALENLGMITEITSGDLDGDGSPEIIFVGDWLPITVFSFSGKSFENRTSAWGLEKTSGWWKTIMLEDMDEDGDLDIIAGNIGLNSRLITSGQYPVTLISNDFDGNGSLDPILCFYHEQKLYPFAGRDMIIGQIPALKKKFIRYHTYASASVEDIFTKEELKGSTRLKVNTFETHYLVNAGKKFSTHPLPVQAQLSPVYGIVVHDFNGDGRKDILMAGQFSYAETETGEMDAGNGVLLLQKSDGQFEYVPNIRHGFWAQQEVRELAAIRLADGYQAILTANNRGPVEMHYVMHTGQ